MRDGFAAFINIQSTRSGRLLIEQALWRGGYPRRMPMFAKHRQPAPLTCLSASENVFE